MWKSWLTATLLLSTITKKTVSLTFTSLDRDLRGTRIAPISARTRKVSCTDNSALRQLTSNLVGNGVAASVTCNSHTWVTKKCNGGGSMAMCVDCADPCNAFCSSDNLYIAPCESCPNYDELIRVLAVDFKDIFPPPQINNLIVNPVPNSRNQLKVDLSFDATTGDVYCAAIDPSVTLHHKSLLYASSTSIGVHGKIQNNIANITISGLIASTSYAIYCTTSSDEGGQMSLSSTKSTRTLQTTGCCKYTVLSMPNRVLLSSATTELMSVYLEAPSYTGSVTITFHLWHVSSGNNLRLSNTLNDTHKVLYGTIDASDGSICGSNPIDPPSITFTSGHSIKTLSTRKVSLLSGCPMGLYFINASLSNAAANEYEVVVDGGEEWIHIAGTVAPPVPQPISAIFDSSGSTILITFDQTTDRAGLSDSFSCNKLLSFTTSDDSATCKWVEGGSALSIRTTSVNLNDEVTILQDKIRSFCLPDQFTSSCATWNTVSTTILKVKAHIDSVSPTVLISTPTVVGACQSLEIDILSSSGSGGRAWKQVNITASSSVGLVATQQLQSYIDANFVVNPPLNVPHSYLRSSSESNVTITLSVTLCNFMSKCSSAHKHVYAVDTSALSVRIPGQPVRELQISQKLDVRALLLTEVCSGVASYNAADIQLFWNMLQDGVTNVSLVSTSLDPTRFLLNPHTLKIGKTYQVIVTAISTSSSSTTGSTASVDIFIKPGPIMIQVPGSSSYIVNQNQVVTLDASTTFDTDYPSLTPAQAGISFNWECWRELPTYDNTCPFALTNSGSSLLVAGTSNGVGEVAVIRLIASKGTRIATKTFNITGIAVTHPTIGLAAVTIINSGVRLEIRADIETSYACSLEWSSPHTDLTATGATLSTLFGGITNTNGGSFPHYLSISGNALTSGATYSFFLKVTQNSGNYETTAAIQVYVNSPPIPGKLNIEPDTGNPMSTFFRLTTAYWTDFEHNMPLEFMFTVNQRDLDSELVLRERSEHTGTLTQLPPASGEGGSGDVTVFVHVWDSLDASSQLSQVITLTAASGGFTSSTVQSDLSTRLADSLTTNEKRGIIGIYGPYVNSADCSSSSVSAVACAALNRESCSSVTNTCGPCLSNFQGQKGHSTSQCVSDFVVARKAAEITSASCVIDTECATWQECASGKCSPLKKRCPNNCSGHGTCKFTNSLSMTEIDTCYVWNHSCEAKCSCDSGYDDVACSVTSSDHNTRSNIRGLLLSNLAQLEQEEDLSDEVLVGWTNLLGCLTGSAYELGGNYTQLEISQSIASNIISHASTIDVNIEKINGLALVMNSLFIAVTSSLQIATDFKDARRRKLTGINWTFHKDYDAITTVNQLNKETDQLLWGYTNLLLHGLSPGESYSEEVSSGVLVRAVKQLVENNVATNIDLSFNSSYTSDGSTTANTDVQLEGVTVASSTYLAFATYQISRMSLGADPIYRRYSVYREPLYLSHPIVIQSSQQTSLNKVSVGFQTAEYLNKTDRNLRNEYWESYTDMCFDERIDKGETISAYTHLCNAPNVTIQINCRGIWEEVTQHCPELYTDPICFMGNNWAVNTSLYHKKATSFDTSQIQCNYDTSSLSPTFAASNSLRLVPLATYRAQDYSPTYVEGLEGTRRRPNENVLINTMQTVVIIWAVFFFIHFAWFFWTHFSIQLLNISNMKSSESGQVNVAPLRRMDEKGNVSINSNSSVTTGVSTTRALDGSSSVLSTTTTTTTTSTTKTNDNSLRSLQPENNTSASTLDATRGMNIDMTDISYLPQGDHAKSSLHFTNQENVEVSVKVIRTKAPHQNLNMSAKKRDRSNEIYNLLWNTLPLISRNDVDFIWTCILQILTFHRWFNFKLFQFEFPKILALSTSCIIYLFVPALALDMATIFYIDDDCGKHDLHSQCLQYHSRLNDTYIWDQKCYWDFDSRDCHFDYRRYYGDGWSFEHDMWLAILLAIMSTLIIAPFIAALDWIVANKIDVEFISTSTTDNEDDEEQENMEEDRDVLHVLHDIQNLKRKLNTYVSWMGSEVSNDDDTTSNKNTANSNRMTGTMGNHFHDPDEPKHFTRAQRALMDVWGLDEDGNFLMERGGDNLIRRLEVCIFTAYREAALETQWLTGKSKIEQGKRLLYLLIRDQIGTLPGEIMKEKMSRDFHAQNKQAIPYTVFIFYLSSLLLVNSLMIWYLIIFWTPALGYYQAQERQYNLVWCFAYICFVEFISRTLEVLTVHIWIPRSIQTSVVEAVDAVAQEVYNYLQNGPRNDNAEMDFGDSTPSFDSSRFLSVANLVSRRLPELIERDIVAAFAPRVPSHYRLRIGTGAIICHYMYLLPVVVQDLLLNFIYTIAIHLVLLSQVFANMNPNEFLPFVPILVVIIVIIMAIAFTKLTEFFIGRRLVEDTILEKYGKSDAEVRGVELGVDGSASATTSSVATSSANGPSWGMSGSIDYATSMKSFFGPLHENKVHPYHASSAINSNGRNDSRMPEIGRNNNNNNSNNHENNNNDADEFSNTIVVEDDHNNNSFNNTNHTGMNSTNDSMDLHTQKNEGPDDFLKNPFDGSVTLARRKKKPKLSNSYQCAVQ